MAEVIGRISDADLIEGFLQPKANGEASAIPRFIVDNMEEEVYTREPWLLPQPTDPMLNPGEWLYLGKRNWRYRDAEGVDCVGAWILMEGRSPIFSEESGELIGGSMRFRYCFKDKNNEEAPMKWSNWYMREYRLCDKFGIPYANHIVLCKIACNHFLF